MTDIDVAVADKNELPVAQRFYESRGYGGAAVVPSDFVVLAKERDRVVGVGRLCQEHDLLWLRGMQVEPQFQGQGIGARILSPCLDSRLRSIPKPQLFSRLHISLFSFVTS